MARPKKMPDTEKKPPKRRKTLLKVKPEKVDFPNDDIDLNSYEWGDNCRLSDKQKLFVVWYVHPAMKHNAYQSAVKAGYSVKSAKVLCGKLKSDPEIMSYVKKFEAQFLRTSLEDFYNEAIQNKIKRASYDVNDFHEMKTFTDGNGIDHEYLSIKDPSTLTPEQRKCIDEIKINNNGSPSYVFADRTHETEFLLKLKERLDGEGNNEDSFQVETTAEIIKGNLQVKTKVIKANQETAEMSELSTIGAINREEED